LIVLAGALALAGTQAAPIANAVTCTVAQNALVLVLRRADSA
jgi:hypothetical protein